MAWCDNTFSSSKLFIVNICFTVGTTWTKQIVKLIWNKGEEDRRKVVSALPWLENEKRVPTIKYADEMPSPRGFNTHQPYSMMAGGLPHTTPAKYIYIARNPKDVCVSYYYHMRAFKAMNYYGTWDEFYQVFVSERAPLGGWFDHVLEWWKHKDAENILFLKYEDMKKDCHALVKRIGEFLGYDMKEEVVDKVAEQTTFQAMKANPAANFEWPEIYTRKPGEQPFMRKGVVGDWKNHFTLEQNAEFDAIYAEKMKGSGLGFDFE